MRAKTIINCGEGAHGTPYAEQYVLRREHT